MNPKKIKAWLMQDLWLCCIYGLIVFIISLASDVGFALSILVGIACIIKLKLFIYIFIRMIFLKHIIGESTNKTPINDIEQSIINDLITKIKNDKTTINNLDQLIIEQIRRRNYMNEDWQIHYAKERIKEIIEKISE